MGWAVKKVLPVSCDRYPEFRSLGPEGHVSAQYTVERGKALPPHDLSQVHRTLALFAAWLLFLSAILPPLSPEYPIADAPGR